MIEICNLKKIYRKRNKKGLFRSSYEEFEAVKNISMNIEEGKIVGLLGVNGAGKTTTIKMLSTLLTPDGGYGKIDGMDLMDNSKEIRNIINMVSGGERMLYWRLTAKENLEYFGKLYGIENKYLNEDIERLLLQVDLYQHKDQPVETFSKGMKQRLQIARGLINNPKYLFLDEPTLGLDVSIAHKIRDLYRSLAQDRKKGILLTSHYMNEMEDLCDYIYVIDKGENLLEGDPKSVIKKLSGYNEKIIINIKETKESLIKELEYFSRERELSITFNKSTEIEIVSSEKDIQGALMSLISKYTNIVKFTSESPSLEEVIVELEESRSIEK